MGSKYSTPSSSISTSSSVDFILSESVRGPAGSSTLQPSAAEAPMVADSVGFTTLHSVKPRLPVDENKLCLLKSTGNRKGSTFREAASQRIETSTDLRSVTFKDDLGFTAPLPVKPSNFSDDHRSSMKLVVGPECPLPYNLTRRGKWAKFSGTDEELARTALDHAKFKAAKRRPLLKQISHSMSRRNGFNSQEEFDTVEEQWVWAPNNSYEKLQLQAVNCSICGNYISVSNPEFPLPDRILCNCNDGLEEFVEYEYEEEKNEEIV